MSYKLQTLHEDLAQHGVSYKELNVLFFSQVFIAEKNIGVYSKINLINILKILSLDNIVKLFIYKLRKLIGTDFKKNTYDFLFVNEVDNTAIISSLKNLSDKFSNLSACEIYTNKRIKHLFKNESTIINIFHFFGIRCFLFFLLDVILSISVLHKNRIHLKYISRKYEVNVWLLILNFWESLFVINVVNCFLKKMNFKKIILNTDVHKFSRIIVLTAKRYNIPTFVLQHGATIGEAGYLPILADKMLVWGESSKIWFSERGQPEDKSEIVGSPRMDSVLYTEPNLQSKTVKSVLVGLSGITHEEHFLESIRDAFITCGLKETKIIIKLHPSSSVEHSSIPERIFRGSNLKYKIVRNQNIKEIFDSTDIVFVTGSSIGMEATIFNKPLFQYKSELLNYHMSYEDFNCSHIFRNTDDIVKVISDSQAVFSKLKNYPAFVENYFYKLDGNSSQRAMDYIIQYH